MTNRLAYEKSDIESIQTAAKSRQLEIIPLIQTFGHMEWLLKLRQFELYRDDLTSPMVITPCLNTTYILLEGSFFISPVATKQVNFSRSSTTNIGHASE